MRYNARMDCLITLYQEGSVYVKDKAAQSGAKHPLHTRETLVISKQQSNEFFLATNVTKMLAHNT